MAQKRKLQIFVSSTYTDLRTERQAAVEAILTAGHIPAGMELFTAGDESQMSVIQRWIDESDIYLLILGGRYGSLEPKSEKSYIHLEYEYAVTKGKPLFAVVITPSYLEEKVKQTGTEVVEIRHAQQLSDFRALVLSKMVRFWSNPLEIKLAILETLADFSRRDNLIGWVPGNEVVDTSELAEQLARLTKENAVLREQVKQLSLAAGIYNGLNFDEMYRLLALTKGNIFDFEEQFIVQLKKIAEIFGDPEPGILHAFWMLSEQLRSEGSIDHYDTRNMNLVKRLEQFGLVEQIRPEERDVSRTWNNYKLSESAKQFLVRLRLERNTEKAEEFIFDAS
jgi:hypothetical protein